MFQSPPTTVESCIKVLFQGPWMPRLQLASCWTPAPSLPWLQLQFRWCVTMDINTWWTSTQPTKNRISKWYKIRTIIVKNYGWMNYGWIIITIVKTSSNHSSTISQPRGSGSPKLRSSSTEWSSDVVEARSSRSVGHLRSPSAKSVNGHCPSYWKLPCIVDWSI